MASMRGDGTFLPLPKFINKCNSEKRYRNLTTFQKLIVKIEAASCGTWCTVYTWSSWLSSWKPGIERAKSTTQRIAGMK